MIYFVYLLVMSILLFIERNDKNIRRMCRVLIPILYALFIGLRGKSNGVDTYTYYEHYYTYGRWGCDFVEPGFDWINRICFSMGWEANSLFLVMAGITCLFLYLSLEKLNRKDYTVSAFFLYLFTFPFLVNGMRQGVAVAVFFYAYRFIINRNWVSYVISLLFASLFHASALLLLPLYLLNQYRLSRNLYTIIYLLSFLGIFIDISSYLPEIQLGNRDYSNYATEVDMQSASSLGFIVTTLLNIIVFYMMQKNQLYKKNPLLFNFVLIDFCLKNLGFSIPIIGRMTIYFSWFVYLLYPYIFFSCKNYLLNNRMITITLILFIYISIWGNSLLTISNKLLPYHFFWE